MRSKKKKGKNKPPLPLPRDLRNEMRMTVALRGYADIKCGRSMKLPDQHKKLFDFFHGKPSCPPQIELFAQANINYRDFFDSETVTSSKKTDTSSDIVRYYLKPSITQDPTRRYFSGVDLRYDDLEKKNRTGSALITGRNLVDMALRGVRNFKKALAFSLHKWDAEKCVPNIRGIQ